MWESILLIALILPQLGNSQSDGNFTTNVLAQIVEQQSTQIRQQLKKGLDQVIQELKEITDAINEGNVDYEELQRVEYLGKQWKYAAWSCAELAEKKPDYKNGYYWVQGNQGHSPYLVYCDLITRFSQGGKGWLRVANFNTADPNQECPSQFTLITQPKRLCIRQQYGLGCSSMYFSSSGNAYRLVCGTVRAYAHGSLDGFYRYDCPNPCTINHHYVDGVSITHRRKHIWTYARFCSHIPHFIGNSYSCHRFSPISFCKTLQQSTSDSLEVRVCRDQDRGDEDVRLELVELYVQ